MKNYEQYSFGCNVTDSKLRKLISETLVDEDVEIEKNCQILTKKEGEKLLLAVMLLVKLNAFGEGSVMPCFFLVDKSQHEELYDTLLDYLKTSTGD